MISQKIFTQFVGLLFGLKAIFGLFYILNGWEATIAGWIMPLWLMVVAVIVDGYLAYVAAKLTKLIK